MDECGGAKAVYAPAVWARPARGGVAAPVSSSACWSARVRPSGARWIHLPFVAASVPVAGSAVALGQLGVILWPHSTRGSLLCLALAPVLLAVAGLFSWRLVEDTAIRTTVDHERGELRVSRSLLDLRRVWSVAVIELLEARVSPCSVREGSRPIKWGAVLLLRTRVACIEIPGAVDDLRRVNELLAGRLGGATPLGRI